MKLADLIDLELGCIQDHGKDPTDLRHRDREIGRTALAEPIAEKAGTPAFRRRLFGYWLERRRAENPGEFPGRHIEAAYGAIGWLLVLLGLVSGGSTASVVLHFDGTTPVNVVHFLAVFVGLQLALLLLFPLTVLVWRRGERQGGLFGFYHLVRWLGEWMSTRLGRLVQRLPGERQHGLLAARGRLKAISGVYLPAEKWLLLELQKRFGLAFNLGALATVLYLVAFSDLAFAWSTTLDLDSRAFHSLVSVLGTPWSWALEGASPSLEMVEASRYFRLDGSYVGPALSGRAIDPILVGGWWPFLLMSLGVYGLLPRLMVWAGARFRFRSALRHVSLRHGDFEALYERLVLPAVLMGAQQPERGVAVPKAGDQTSVVGGLDQWQAIPSAAAIWGDIPVAEEILETVVRGRFGWKVDQVVQAGVGDHENDAQACRRLREAFEQGCKAVLVLAESFEPPTLELVKFLRELRRSIGSESSLVVALFDYDGQGRWIPPGEEDWRIWRSKLEALSDPFLRIERLVEGT